MRGEPSSQFRLGLIYANGHSVEQDFNEAMLWIKRAFYYGHPGAKLYLGVSDEKVNLIQVTLLFKPRAKNNN